MHYPDAQLEYNREDGRTGRVNIEVASVTFPPFHLRYQRTAQRISWGSVCRHLKIAGRIAFF